MKLRRFSPILLAAAAVTGALAAPASPDEVTDLVDRAYRQTEYYRSVMDARRLKPRDIQGVADLPKLPILTSRDIRSNFDAFVSARVHPEDLIETVLSHAEHIGLPRDTPLKRTLFACDELSGFIHACGLVRPTGLDGLTPKSVRKKLKQPSFAAGVNREEVRAGAEELGVDLMARIPLLPAMGRGADEGHPVAVAAPGSEVESAFDQLARAVIEKRPRIRTNPALVIN